MVFGVVWHSDRNLLPKPLETEVRAAAGGAPVVVLGSTDLRSLLGRRLDRVLTTLSDGGAASERAYTDPERLSAALERSPHDVVVVSTVRGVPAVPAGWRPPETWRRVASVERNDVYTRSGST
jgi:hypothetical protein